MAARLRGLLGLTRVPVGFKRHWPAVTQSGMQLPAGADCQPVEDFFRRLTVVANRLLYSLPTFKLPHRLCRLPQQLPLRLIALHIP